MVDRTAPAPALREVQLTLFQRMRAIFLRYEPLRGYALLSPTMGVMLLALALPVGLLGAYSFWTQNYLDIDHTLTTANYAKFFKGTADAIQFQMPGIEFSPFSIIWPIEIHLPIYPSLLLKSMRISGMVTLATVLLAYPMAYFIAFRVTAAQDDLADPDHHTVLDELSASRLRLEDHPRLQRRDQFRTDQPRYDRRADQLDPSTIRPRWW